MARVGIIHVHSRYSYDGQHTLEEIRLFAKNRGYSFVGMAEHSDTLDEDKMSHFVAECRRLSDPAFLLIPGIEFTCDGNLHLLGLGIEHFSDTKSPISVARFIRGQGGVAIVSHPIRYDYNIPSGLEGEIHGIEIWNAAYDGRFVPNDRSIALWQALRGRNSTLRAFGGQDLHEISGRCHVKITLPCDELKQETILQLLKEGNFLIANPYFRLRPSHLAGETNLHSIIWARRIYCLAKGMRDRFTRLFQDAHTR